MSPIALERTKSGNAWRMSGHPKIDKEISALLPSLSPEEQAGLEKDVVENGCRDCLIVWDETDILIEGHHRLAICKKHDISYYVRFLSFPTREKALQWVIDNQCGRRNMSREQRAYVIAKDYLLKKGEHGGDRTEQETKEIERARSQNETLLPADEEIAKKHKVSPATVNRAAEFATALDAHSEEERAAVLAGDVKITQAAVIAAPAILCEACKRRKRVGQPIPENCSACKEVRKPDDPAPKKKPPKNGRVTFDDRIVMDLLGKLARAFNDRSKSHGGESKEFKDCREKWNLLEAAWKRWQLAKEKAK